MARKTKRPGANLPVPQDDGAARETIRVIGEKERRAERLTSEMNDEIAVIQDRYGKEIAPIKGEVEVLKEGLGIYCEAHRDRLTKGGKTKTAAFATGKVSWRLKPVRVTITPRLAGLASPEEMIAKLKALGLHRFVRVKEEYNKEAMREEADTAREVQGISVGSGDEEFIVEPYEADVRETA